MIRMSIVSPAKVADCVFQTIADKRFYILTHPEFAPVIKARVKAIVNGQNPVDLRTVIKS